MVSMRSYNNSLSSLDLQVQVGVQESSSAAACENRQTVTPATVSALHGQSHDPSAYIREHIQECEGLEAGRQTDRSQRLRHKPRFKCHLSITALHTVFSLPQVHQDGR